MKKIIVALLAILAVSFAFANPASARSDWPETPTTLGSSRECMDGKTLYNVTVFNDADVRQKIYWEFTKAGVTTQKSMWLPKHQGAYAGAFLSTNPITDFRIWVIGEFDEEVTFFHRFPTNPVQPLSC